MLYLPSFGHFADMAADGSAAVSDVRNILPARHSVLALLILLVAVMVTV